MKKQIEGQINLFNTETPEDSLFGKMSKELSAATREEISQQSLLSVSESKSRKLPIFLYLNTDGPTQELSWETAFLSLGESTTLSFGVSPKDGNASLWSPTTMDCLPQESCLSAILESEVDPKYFLSQRACLGILTRATRRGKELPMELREALLTQANMTEDQFVAYYQNLGAETPEE